LVSVSFFGGRHNDTGLCDDAHVQLGEFFFQGVSLSGQVFDGGFQSSFVLVIGRDSSVFGSEGGLEFDFNLFSEVGQHVFDLFQQCFISL
jgi:hypothetical protein